MDEKMEVKDVPVEIVTDTSYPSENSDLVIRYEALTRTSFSPPGVNCCHRRQ